MLTTNDLATFEDWLRCWTGTTRMTGSALSAAIKSVDNPATLP